MKGTESRVLRKPTFIIVVILFTASLVFASCKSEKPLDNNSQWNFIFICVDTLRADHLGVYGYDRNTSPNIDKFAKESMVFERAYSHSPWTMPSVASMFTSLHPKNHGIKTWLNPLQRRFLTLGEHFKANGFRTEGYASHVTFIHKYGFDQGFDVWNTEVLDKPGKHKKKHVSKELTDLAINALDRPIEQPFFMFLHYFDPHNDYVPHKDFRFGKRPVDLYDGEIAYTDHHIGRLFKYLRKTGLMEKTVILFIADHGEEFRDHGGTRHSKTLYEEVLKIPLVIRVPGFDSGRNKTVVSEMDVAPTLCNLAKIPIPSQFKGKAISYDSKAFNPTTNRIIIGETYRSADKRGVLDGFWKFIHDREKGRFELYNLENDPKEKINKHKEKNQLALRLKTLLDHYYQGPVEKAPTNPLDADMKEKLKSLGYL